MTFRSKLFATVALPMLSASLIATPSLADALMKPFEVAQASDEGQPSEEELLRQQQEEQQRAEQEEQQVEDAGLDGHGLAAAAQLAELLVDFEVAEPEPHRRNIPATAPRRGNGRPDALLTTS